MEACLWEAIWEGLLALSSAINILFSGLPDIADLWFCCSASSRFSLSMILLDCWDI